MLISINASIRLKTWTWLTFHFRTTGQVVFTTPFTGSVNAFFTVCIPSRASIRFAETRYMAVAARATEETEGNHIIVGEDPRRKPVYLYLAQRENLQIRRYGVLFVMEDLKINPTNWTVEREGGVELKKNDRSFVRAEFLTL